jgi:Tol biopolymer transport system component
MNLKTILRKPIPAWILAVLLIVIIVLTALLFTLNSHSRELPENKEPFSQQPVTESSFTPNSQPHESFEGRILFWHQPRVGDAYQNYGLYMMDGDGSNVNYLGPYTGSPAWSPDGSYIAVGCWSDVSSICILETSTIPDFRNYAFDSTSKDSIVTTEKLNLPVACQNAITAAWGIQSISWSADGGKIAVVCGNEFDKQHEVCILPLSGSAYCWDQSISRSVTRAVFSPVEDRLAISYYPAYGAQIYLVNPDGSGPIYLTEGWSPEWSPDGSRIAFIRFEEGAYSRDKSGEIHIDFTHRTYRELVVINKDGTGLRRIYWRPENDDGVEPAIYLDCYLLGEACRLAWSPDGHYIAFTSGYRGGGIYGTFRIDLATESIFFLLDPSPMTGFNGELDWGP